MSTLIDQITATEQSIAGIESELTQLQARLAGLVDVSVAPNGDTIEARISAYEATAKAEADAKVSRAGVQMAIDSLNRDLTEQRQRLAHLLEQSQRTELESQVAIATKKATALSKELQKAYRPVLKLLQELKALHLEHNGAFQDLQRIQRREAMANSGHGDKWQPAPLVQWPAESVSVSGTVHTLVRLPQVEDEGQGFRLVHVDSGLFDAENELIDQQQLARRMRAISRLG